MKHKPPLAMSAALLGVIALCIAVPLLFGGMGMEAIPWFVFGVAILSAASLTFSIVSLRRKRTAASIAMTIITGLTAAVFLFIATYTACL